jgi:hypothetical protein
MFRREFPNFRVWQKVPGLKQTSSGPKGYLGSYRKSKRNRKNSCEVAQFGLSRKYGQRTVVKEF